MTAYVEVLGSVNMDIVTSTTELPRPGETVTAKGLAHFPGGKGANQAIASARLDAPTQLIGAIGDDEFGAQLSGNLSANIVGIDALITKKDLATGQAMICVADSGENFIVVVPGANHALLPMDLPCDSQGNATVCLAQFEMPLDTIEARWSSAATQGATKILNAAPALLDGLPLFDLAAFIIVNEVELACYAGGDRSAAASEAMLDQARKLIVRDDQHVVVTVGVEGAIAVSASDWFRVEGQRAKVVDTTGAGDCFCGALAAALFKGQELRPAIAFANAAAAISVGRVGAGPSMPTLKELNEA